MNAVFVRRTAVAIASLAACLGMPLAAQSGSAASLTPFAGFLIAGNWYEGPVGTSLKNSNGPAFGVQGSVPLTKGFALTGSLAYASGDLRIGLPLLGGVNVGSADAWMYDAGIEVGGLAARPEGIAAFATAGIGGMTNDISAKVFNVRATNVAYTLGVGVDVGFTPGMAVRLQAKDWIGKFNSKDAIGFRAEGNLAHNFALTAGLKFTF